MWHALVTAALAFTLLGCGRQTPPTSSQQDVGPPQRTTTPTQAAPPTPPIRRAARLDDGAIAWLVEAALRRGELPGCVIAVGRRDGLHYLRAFGQRTAGEPMTVDTRFDLASLTKPLATGLGLMLLSEQGALSISEPVAHYLKPFDRPDKRAIRVEHLLLHTSGLPKVSALSHMEQGRQPALSHIAALPLEAPPGKTFEYSDLGFIVLGELVARLAGQPLDRFVGARIYDRLGLRDTLFLPNGDAPERYAPTEERDDAPIRGVVDDPRAYRLGGVAGHAGLFATAGDVARLARLILRGGELDGTRVFSSETADLFLTPRPVPGGQRALGWDAESAYAHGRGSTMSAQAIGHGGYTGTSVWIDPAQDAFVVFLSNRVHVGAKGRIHPLVSSIGDLALRMLRRASEPTRPAVGIDVLADAAFASLRGRSVVLLTHQAARDRDHRTTFERIREAPSVELKALLTPEHGFFAKAEGHVQSTKLEGLPAHSLFGKRRKPTARMLRGADTLVIDLVDVGTRFYTYMATALRAIEAASEQGLDVVLLDRPNPLDGEHVEGPVSEASFESFVNYHPLPVRHGMTAGELARWLVRQREIAVNLHVVRVEGWKRSQWFGDTPFTWVAPSPNLKSPAQAMLYSAVGLVEGTNVSVGRGTDRAFFVVGAPFIDGSALKGALGQYALQGVSVELASFRPSVGPHAGLSLKGIAFSLTDPHAFSSAKTGLSLIRALAQLYPERWDRTRLARMVANQKTLAMLETDATIDEITRTAWSEALAAFQSSRRDALLYP